MALYLLMKQKQNPMVCAQESGSSFLAHFCLFWPKFVPEHFFQKWGYIFSKNGALSLFLQLPAKKKLRKPMARSMRTFETDGQIHKTVRLARPILKDTKCIQKLFQRFSPHLFQALANQ